MSSPIAITDLRGGRNGTDDPMALPATQCVEALNVDWSEGLLGHKRGGADTVATTGGTAFGAELNTLIRHLPSGAETAAELWGIDSAGLVKRLAAGTTFADVTLDDSIENVPYHAVGVSLNGKLFLAYNSTQDRLHAYDPALSSARVRRVGIAPGSNAPTVADQGPNVAYAAVLRYYRVRFLQISGSKVIRRSEPTPSVSFTPDGAHTSARVTRPTAPSEGETHWEVEASIDNTTFFVIAGFSASTHIAIATTTYDDIILTTAYATYAASAVSGTYALFPSVKYLLTDGNRLLGAGSWESSGTYSGGKTSRIWFSAVLGSSDQGDDERVPNTTTQKNWVDLNENDGGAITGLGGPFDGKAWAFKFRQIWKLTPTGDVSVPYLPRKVADGIGCVSHKSIVVGEDEAGQPALYFMSHRGPYRIGANGLQYLGRDNEDLWRTIGLSTSGIIAHAVWYPDKHQVWFWYASTVSSVGPDQRVVFDVQLGVPDAHNQVRGGWAKHTGLSAGTTGLAPCSTMFSATPGASMSLELKPYVGRASSPLLLKCDTTSTDDGGTTFQAYVKSRPLVTSADLGVNVGLGQAYLMAKAQSGVTITQTLDRDMGAETRTSTVLLTAAASETRVVRKFEGSEMAEAALIQVQLGDASAVASTWTLDAWTAALIRQGVR